MAGTSPAPRTSSEDAQADVQQAPGTADRPASPGRCPDGCSRVARPARSVSSIGRLDRQRRPLRDTDEFVACARRRLVQRQQQRGPMADRARRDRPSPRRRSGRPPVSDRVDRAARACLASEVVEVGLVALDQFDDDRLLRLEVVVEAPGQDAGGVGDLLQRCAQALRREQCRRGVEDLRSSRLADRHRVHSCSRAS